MLLGQHVSKKLYRIVAVLLSLALVLQASPLAAGPDPRQPGWSVASRPVAHRASVPRTEPNAPGSRPLAVPAPGAPALFATPQPVAPALPVAAGLAAAHHPWPAPTPLAQVFDAIAIQPTVVTPAPRAVPPFLNVPPEILPPVPQTEIPTQIRPAAKASGLAAPVPAASIALAPGWNLVSIPEVPPDTDPAAVLASIAGNFNLVYAYDACDLADPWKLYDPNAPVASDLTAIDPSMGLWIEMTAADTLEVAGTIPASTAIQLCTGWNLIGYPRDQALPVTGALYSIAGSYSRVFAYAAAGGVDPWSVHTAGAPSYANDLQSMAPGRGYWVLATADVTATISGPLGPVAVGLVSHADGDEITSPISVTAVITGTTTASWVMEYRPIDDPTWTAFGSGDTAVTGQPEAQFDPTLLLNGIYQIRLTATDLFGQSAGTVADVVLEGQMKVGLFTISFIDLDIPVVGIPIQLIRTYDSRDKRTGDFGVGWTLDIRRGSYKNNRKPGDGWIISSSPKTSAFPSIPCSISNATKSHITEIRFSDVDFYRFALQVQMIGFGSAIGGGCLGMASFVQIGGIPGATLDVLGDTDVYWQNGSNQLLDFNTFQVYEPEAVRLTTADGRQFDLSLANGLEHMSDRNGNAVTIDRDGITHSGGKSVDFIRDGQGRITSIIDPMGNSLAYSYDANSDLISVVNPDGNTTRFTYDNRHNLLDIINPLGVTAARNEYDANGRLVATVDADGNRIAFTHDLGTRQEVVWDRLGNVTVVEYDSRGNVTSRTDSLGNETRYTYDEYDNMLTETDALGRPRTLTYDSNDNVLTETNFDGDRITLAYNARNQVLTYSDSRGRTTTNVYDTNGNLLQSTDSVGAAVQYTYDAAGNTLSLRDPLGNLTQHTYDGSGNQTSIVDPLNHVVSYVYDARDRLTGTSITTTLPGGSIGTLRTQYEYSSQDEVLRSVDALGHAFNTQMNEIGKPASTTDKNGNVIRYEYDALGHRSKKIYSDGSTDSYVYDAEGRKLSQTDRDGHTTRWEYDALGRPVRTTYPDGTSTNVTYDAIGRVLSLTDERGQTTTYGYAPHTEVLTDTLGNTTVSQFDSDGNLVRYTDANGHTSTYTYDLGGTREGRGRLIRMTFPDGTMTQIAYDAAGQEIAQTDQAGTQTHFGYDAAGQLILVTDAREQQTHYTYDSRGNLATYSDANGHTTRLEYDARNRLIRRTLPLGQMETFGYDAQGNMITHTDFNGRTTTYTYNSGHRVVEIRMPDGSVKTYTYTADGLRTSAAGDTFTYDIRGRMLSETKADGTVLTYTYDAAGNRTSVTTPQGQVTYSYNQLNRLETVTDSQGGITRYTYDAVGNLSSMVQPDGSVTTYTYDVVNRLTQLETKDSKGVLLASYTYTRDPVGHVTRVVEAPSGRSVDYTYDALYRLISETVNQPGQAAQTTVYTYDAVGNRLSKQTDQGITTYVYDANNRLTRESSASGDIIYSYDDNGNLIRKSGPSANLTYQYDSRNRLLVMRNGTDEVVYTYDADSNRIRTVVNGAEVTNFLVDKNGPLPQVLLETDRLGVVTSSYVYGNDLISIQHPNLGTHYYHYDGQMSTRQLSDTTGAVSDAYTYDAFGKLLASTGTTENHFLYTGEEYDPNLDFYYLRARHYDAAVGRFITPDPLDTFDLQDPSRLHKYLYGHGDPINNWDPTGQLDISLTAFSVGYAIGAILISIALFAVLIPGAEPNSVDRAKIRGALSGAKDMVKKQAAGNWQLGYSMWFGIPMPGPPPYSNTEKYVEAGWQKIQEATDERIEFARYGFGCWTSSSRIAYVSQNDNKLKIWLCEPFFNKKVRGGWDTQAGTLIHELSHEAHDTEDDDDRYGRYHARARII